MRESLSDMIKKDPNKLNLDWNLRRCILLALIKTDFDFNKAWLINAPELELSSYKRIFYRHHLSIKKIKKEYIQMLNNNRK